MRRAVSKLVLNVDLLPIELVSAHCADLERGRPITSKLITKDDNNTTIVNLSIIKTFILTSSTNHYLMSTFRSNNVKDEIISWLNLTFYLYIGLVALSLNHKMRKTSLGPLLEVISQGRTPVVPCSPDTAIIGTEVISIFTPIVIMGKV